MGESVVESATTHNVEVRSSFLSKQTCCHNKYGIGTVAHWGGGFPTTICNGAGNNDLCMQVAVMSRGSSVDGVTGEYIIFDTPISNSDWPNRHYLRALHDDVGPPFLSVWLR